VIDLFESIADARIYRGRDEAEQFWTEWRETWENFRCEIDEYVDAGESVVLLGSRKRKEPAVFQRVLRCG